MWMFCGGMWMFCGCYVEHCGGMWNIVEECGCFVDVIWNIVEECWFYVEHCEGMWMFYGAMWMFCGCYVEHWGGMWMLCRRFCGAMWMLCGTLWRNVDVFLMLCGTFWRNVDVFVEKCGCNMDPPHWQFEVLSPTWSVILKYVIVDVMWIHQIFTLTIKWTADPFCTLYSSMHLLSVSWSCIWILYDTELWHCSITSG